MITTVSEWSFEMYFSGYVWALSALLEEGLVYKLLPTLTIDEEFGDQVM